MQTSSTYRGNGVLPVRSMEAVHDELADRLVDAMRADNRPLVRYYGQKIAWLKASMAATGFNEIARR